MKTSVTSGKLDAVHLWWSVPVLNMIRFPDRNPTGFSNSEPDPAWTGFRNFNLIYLFIADTKSTV